MDKPPRKSRSREVTEAIIEGAAGAVPVVGSPLAVAMSFALGWAYNQRMQRWLDDLAEAVTDLQQRTEGLKFEDLATDEVFVDAVVNATRAAQATHQREKLEALRNGVLNSLSDDAPSVDEQARFFRLVEQFTGAHLRLLAFFDDPRATLVAAGVTPPDVMVGGRGHLLEQLPEFQGQRTWYDLLTSDLVSAGLLNGGGGLHVTMSGSGVYQSSTSPLGKRFLVFVTDPREE